MPDLLSGIAQSILSMKYYEHEVRNAKTSMVKYSDALFQGKGLENVEKPEEKGIFLDRLLKEEFTDIIFCGAAMQSQYQLFHVDKKTLVLQLYVNERLTNKEINYLYELLNDESKKIYLASADGCGENGVIAFAFFCYQRLCKIFKYPHLTGEAINDFLLKFDTLYKEFIRIAPSIVNSKQYTAAVELVFEWFKIDRAKEDYSPDKTENLLQQASEYFANNRIKWMSENTKGVLQFMDVIDVSGAMKRMELVSAYLEYIKDCYGKDSVQVKKYLADLSEKIEEFLGQKAHTYLFSDLKQLLAELPYELSGKFDNEKIADLYCLQGNIQAKEKDYSEAQAWLMLASVLTKDKQKEEQLWGRLEKEIFPMTVGREVSNENSKARCSLTALEEVILLNKENQSKEFQLDRIHCAGVLFNCRFQMFICDKKFNKTSDKILLVSKVQLRRQESSRFQAAVPIEAEKLPSLFVMHDKVVAALKFLALYTKVRLISEDGGKRAIEQLVEHVMDLPDDEHQNYFIEKLTQYGLPDDYLQYLWVLCASTKPLAEGGNKFAIEQLAKSVVKLPGEGKYRGSLLETFKKYGLPRDHLQLLLQEVSRLEQTKPCQYSPALKK